MGKLADSEQLLCLGGCEVFEVCIGFQFKAVSDFACVPGDVRRLALRRWPVSIRSALKKPHC